MVRCDGPPQDGQAVAPFSPLWRARQLDLPQSPVSRCIVNVQIESLVIMRHGFGENGIRPAQDVLYRYVWPVINLEFTLCLLQRAQVHFHHGTTLRQDQPANRSE